MVLLPVAAALALAGGDPAVARLPQVADPFHVARADPFVLAQTLDDLGFASAAQEFYIEALKRGPVDPRFPPALERLSVLALASGDTSDLVRVALRVPPSSFPASVRDDLYFLVALEIQGGERTGESIKYLEQIGKESPVYPRARLVVGTIQATQGLMKSSIRSFTEAIGSAGDPALVAVARLNIARVYYSIRRYEEAATHYRSVPGDAHAILEGAWAGLMLGREVLPTLVPLREAWLAESTYLEGVALFKQGRHAEIAPLHVAWQTRWDPILEELRSTLAAYSSSQGRARAEEVYRRYLGEDPEGCLPPAFLSTLLRDRELSGIYGRLPAIRAERIRIARMRVEWKGEVAEALEKLEGRLERRAGLLLLEEMVRRANEIGGVSRNFQQLRFSAAYILQQPDAPALLEVMAATNPGPETETLRVAAFSDDPIAGYQRVVTTWPEHHEAWFRLGRALWEAGRDDEAVEAFARVNGAEFGYEAQRYVGTYHFYRKHWPEAEFAFRNARDHYMLAWTLWARGDKVGAVEAMRKATGEQAAADLEKMEGAVRGK